MDEMALGGGGGPGAPGAADNNVSSADQADHSGPLETRLVSKNWQVRAKAYEDLRTQCEAASAGNKGEIFRQHVGQWKIYLKDSNPGGLEKALSCLQAFTDKIHKQLLVESQNEIIAMLAEKCLGHAKKPIVEKAKECLLLIFEVSEAFDESVDTFSALLAHKNVKVLTNGIIGLALLVEQYGVKKVKIQQYAEQMLKNAQNTNPGCKTASYEYYKGVYKWIGEALLPQLETLKKAQLDDLKKLFEEVKAKGNKDKRLTRSDRAKAQEEAIDAAMEEESKQEAAVVDALEFAPEFDVMSVFTPEWQDAYTANTKWQELKDKLDDLSAACANKKIRSMNCDGMAAFLKKEINHKNINVSMAAIRLATALAVGLRKGFEPGVKILIGELLLKFKEKRAMMQDELNKFLDAAIGCTNFEEVADSVVTCLGNNAPGVKTGTLKFVEKIALVTYIDKLQNTQGELLPAMAKAIDDKDGGVRATALHCMGILKGRLTESVTSKYLKDLNSQKSEQIDEAAKEVKPSKYDRPENYKPPAKKAPKKPVDEFGGGDGLDTFEPPKKKKPALGSKKPAKPAATEDAEMKDEEKQPAAPRAPAARKAAPPSSSDRPKAAAGPSKAPSAPVVQEEDLGSGLSKEEAIDKVSEYFDAATVAKFEEAKWQDKQEGFNELKEQITERQPPAQILEAVAKFVKARMKDFKESNINLLKCIVDIFNCMATSCETMSKRTMQCAMAFFVDKIGDIKLSNQIKEMLMNATELVTPKFTTNQIIKHASAAKNPKNIAESCNQVADMIDEFGMGGFPLKEVIDFAKFAAAHSDAKVRTAAMKLFCEIYKHVGEAIRTFMADIKESTLKVIDAELDKISPYKKGEHEKKRSFRGEAAQEAEAAGGAGKKKGGGGGGAVDLLASLPRQDISKKLTAKVMALFTDRDWKKRKEAGDTVEALLREANMRIEANGINDLMTALKNGMKDPNKAVVKVYINLLGLLADALGPNVKQFTKKCFVPMLANLSDKQALVRNDVVAAINKWSEQIGPEVVIPLLCGMCKTENPELRGEGLKWTLQNKEAIKEADTSSMIEPLISCLSDKSKAIREQTEEVIAEIMPITGYEQWFGATKALLPAVQQTLKPILERLKKSAGDAPGGGSKVDAGHGDASPARPKRPTDREEKKAEAPANSFARPPANKPKQKPDLNRSQTGRGASPKPVGKRPATAAGHHGGDEEDAFRITPLQKGKRELADGRSKYPLNEVKGDHVDRLRDFCMAAFGEKFQVQMFAKSQDFQKHIKCVEQLDRQRNVQPDEMIEVLDLVFKWGNLRLTESANTQLAVSVFDFYENLLTLFIESEYQLKEFEAVVLVGTLASKVGVNNKQLQDKIKKLIRMCYEVYDKRACKNILVDSIAKSKNLKGVSACLDLVCEYIENNGIDQITKKDFAAFQAAANSPDKDVREGALRVFGEAYKHLGEEIWRLTKDVPIKVKGLLEQRFKQVAKKTGLNQSQGGRGTQVTNTLADTAEKKRPLVPPGSGKPTDAKKGFGASLKSDKSNEPMESDGKHRNAPDQGSDRTEVAKKFGRMDMNAQEENKVGSQRKQQPSSAQPQDQAHRMQDMFQGKDIGGDNDVEMDGQEDDMAFEVKPGKNQMTRESELDDEVMERLRRAENNLDSDPAVQNQERIIIQHIQQLRNGDLLRRVDSLVALNDTISTVNKEVPVSGEDQQNKTKALINLCNELADAFTYVFQDIFEYPVNDIPLRFTKYFVTIVSKACSSKEIMKEVSHKRVEDLVHQLLIRLLTQNLEKIGENKEGELILKNLNSSMLRMMENCNPTYIFCTLFALLKKYKDDQKLPKLPGLVVKCILKLSKLMDQLIKKLDLAKFLLAMHEYLIVLDTVNRNQNDDLGLRIVKTLINEVVKLKREAVWEHYVVVENHPAEDKHLRKWIQVILKSLPPAPRSEPEAPSVGQPGGSGAQGPPSSGGQSKMMLEFEFKKIVQDLRDNNKFEQGIAKLEKFTKQYPQYDCNKTLQRESEEFAQRVMNGLRQYRNGNSMKSTSGNSDSIGAQQPQANSRVSQFQQKVNAAKGVGGGTDLNRSLKMEQYNNKMAEMQKRSSHLPGTASTNALSNRLGTEVQAAHNSKGRMSAIGGGTQGGQQQLNTSFTEINKNISQQWQAMKSGSKKFGGMTGRPSLTSGKNLANTISNAGGGAAGGGQGGNSGGLNSSQNKFVSKVQSSFASRVAQGKVGTGDNQEGSLGGGSGVQQPSSGLAAQATPTKIGGGIQNKSFKSRLQGMGSRTAGGQIGGGQFGSGQKGQDEAASSNTLQQRLADMKAKLSTFNKPGAQNQKK